MKSPSVSVIIAVKNGERYLAEGLQSVVRQTLPPAEILVIDGRSQDRSAAIAQSFAEVTTISQPDQGLANARNLGIQAACGQLIAFLDHDDLWEAEKLALQVKALQDQQDAQYALTLLRTLVHGALSVEQDAILGVTPSSLLARREVFQTVGLFDPAYQIGCDADWFTRARDLAVAHVVVPKVLLTKRRHEHNLSRQGSLNRQEMFGIARASIARRQKNKG